MDEPELAEEQIETWYRTGMHSANMIKDIKNQALLAIAQAKRIEELNKKLDQHGNYKCSYEAEYKKRIELEKEVKRLIEKLGVNKVSLSHERDRHIKLEMKTEAKLEASEAQAAAMREAIDFACNTIGDCKILDHCNKYQGDGSCSECIFTKALSSTAGQEIQEELNELRQMKDVLREIREWMKFAIEFIIGPGAGKIDHGDSTTELLEKIDGLLAKEAQ